MKYKKTFAILALYCSYKTSEYIDEENFMVKRVRQFTKTSRVIFAGMRMTAIYYLSKRTIQQKHHQASKILKDAFFKNGGLYLKFGQLISSLDVVIPNQYRQEFKDICDQCPQQSLQKINRTITEELRQGIQLFQQFNDKPISCASIAQVHVAKLDGRKVAVKIQRRMLKQSFEGDIKLLQFLIQIGEKLFPSFKFKWFTQELRKNVPKQLNFIEQSKNQKRVKQVLKELKNVYVPQIYQKFLTQKILIMQFIQGNPLTRLNLKQLQQNQKHFISELLSTIFTKMIYQVGFIHGDPHKGNFILRKINNQNQLVLLDHGLYLQLTKEVRLSYCKLWKGVLLQNQKLIEEASIQLGAGEKYKLFTAMITARPFNTVMKNQKQMKKRLQIPSSKEGVQQITNLAILNRQAIVNLLHEMNRDLLLLFKINDFVRNIDMQVGKSSDSFRIIYQRCKIQLSDKQMKGLFGYIYRIYEDLRAWLIRFFIYFN